ncbi:MAG: fibronectin type III domain-containing protein [Carboxylicivirga sp.]|jgi:PKD repeat protein|nr:fibronectin type III domain-containing protein [Carboxylicivirga sp.]
MSHKAIIFYIVLLSIIPQVNAQIEPYLSSPTSTSIWVSWRTNSNTETKVIYGSSDNNLNQSSSGTNKYLGSNYYWHTVKIDGLQANTAYYYKVISGQHSDVYRFKTQPAEGTNIGHYRFAIIGDHQDKDGDRYQSLIDACRDKILEKYASGSSSRNVEDYISLMINDGDQVNTGNLENYEKLQFGQSMPLMSHIPFMTVPGNHELHQDPSLTRYADHYVYDDLSYKGIFGGPGVKGEQYYTFQVANILFVMLNSNLREDSEQYSWLNTVVEHADSDPNIEWVFAVNHHCFYNEQLPRDGISTVRDGFASRLIKTDKYTMHITGHAHLYARGAIRNHPCHVIINGGASWDQHWGEAVSIDYPDVQKTIERQIFQLVDIDLDRREMKVETYSNGTNLSPGFREDVLIDEFYIKLDAPKPNTPKIINSLPEPINLPYTFIGSPYSGQEPFNSVEYQVCGREKNFDNPEFTYKTDYENLYLSSGSPNYTPIDQNKDKDITRLTLYPEDIYKGEKYIRLRYRDQSLHWSDWSEPVQINVTNGKELPSEVPVLWYDLQKDANEKLGSGFNGTLSSGIEFVSDAEKENKVAAFDNTGMITISSGTTSELDLPIQSLSVSCWVKLNSTDNWGGIIGLFQDNGTDEYGWLLGTRGPKFSFALASGGGLYYLTSESSFTSGKWYHVIGTFDGKEQKLYVNGSLKASVSNPGEINYPANGWFQIGSYKDDNEDFRMNGRLSDVIVWERALTQEDATNLYKNTMPPSVNFVANKTKIGSGSNVQFEDLSLFNPVNYSWEFEGGTPGTSIEQNPMVKYETEGAYNVKLSVANEYGDGSLLKEWYINVGKLGIDENQSERLLKIHPNPVQDVFNVKVTDADYINSEIIIYDMQGAMVYKCPVRHINAFFELRVSTLKKGIYLICLRKGKKEVAVRKLVKI